MKHLQENNETYFSHMLFAGQVAIYLSISSTFFLIHSILPFIKIPTPFNLDAVLSTVKEWNEYTHQRKEK